MSSARPYSWTGQPKLLAKSDEPYLVLNFIIVFVTDQERSLRFYRDTLGFAVIVDFVFPSGDRWIEVAPPDGTAKLALVAPKQGSDEYKMIGQFRWVLFLTDSVDAVFEKWSKRGVRFHSPPSEPGWGAKVTRFEDPDGNSFGLADFEEATKEVEAQRLAAAQQAEAERRSVQEMQFAKQVQARLFPQTLPVSPTLDYAGVCLQARQVGGDYYDFLDFGDGRLGLILGDISGKGMAAALLMANLQANVRSQYAVALKDPQRFLESTNQLFYANSADSSYATLFFADYDPHAQQISYVNCGHLPALLFQADGTLVRLESTATVLGLFPNWVCFLKSHSFLPGDILVLYTDGVTECPNPLGEEFGEDRLLEAIRRHRNLASQAILSAIIQEVKLFSAGEQADDITLVVAKCRA